MILMQEMLTENTSFKKRWRTILLDFSKIAIFQLILIGQIDPSKYLSILNFKNNVNMEVAANDR